MERTNAEARGAPATDGPGFNREDEVDGGQSARVKLQRKIDARAAKFDDRNKLVIDAPVRSTRLDGWPSGGESEKCNGSPQGRP